MNYLAHVFLAEDNEESKLGNFLGDFVKGRLTNQYSAGIIKGIKMHRKVDVFTDSHKIVKNSRKLISPKRRRWAGAIIDIFFDHFLTVHWDKYSELKLDDFVLNFYDTLKKFNISVKNDLDFNFEKLIANDWMRKYENIDGLELVFSKLSNRVKTINPLTGSEQELINNYKDFENNFLIFFPQLIEHVEKIRNELKQNSILIKF
ncbi:MAG: ACP phosphodiesterase [Thermodesulfobacteriota bacterium]